jgi:Family of unknown function (DUF5687)
MIRTLWSHQWKSFWRSSSSGKGVAIRIFVGFIVLYLLSMAVLLGLRLNMIIEKVDPGRDTIQIFCGFLLYYFAIDIIARFFLQDLPTLTIKPYLILPIRRRDLISFLNVRSLFSFFNLLPVLLFFPFIVTVINAKFGGWTSLVFLIAASAFILANHYLILYFKRKMELNNGWLVGFFLACVALGLADYYKIFSFSRISNALFSTLLTRPWVCVFPVLFSVAVYINNDRFLLNNLYLEEEGDDQTANKTNNLRFLDRYGITGELIALDLKLIWRNKRPRTMVLYSLIFIFYGFILYTPKNIASPSHWSILMFGGLLITGITLFNYGSFLFSWQSNYFDGLMSTNLPIQAYLKGKWFLLSSMSSAMFIISSFYGLIDSKLIIIQLACYLYNMGVNVVVLMYFATWNYKNMDLSRGSMMNYQATGIVQWLFTLLLILIPAIIYFCCYYLGGPWSAIIVLALVGLISLLMRDWWIVLITKEFKKRKYSILQGFREK